MDYSTIQASKPGKLILLGEYAVLEQAPCLVAAVDRNCNVNVEANSLNTFKLEATNPDIPDVQFVVDENNELKFKSDLTAKDHERLRFVIAVLKNVIADATGQFNPATIFIDTKSFYHAKSGDKLGLGASAAITVSLLSALSEYIGKPVSGVELYRAAYPIHRKAQGKLGSGSDIAASAVGGVIKYEMPQHAGNGTGVIDALSWPEDLQVIPVWAGKSASTQDLVQQVKIYRDENSSSYYQIMKPMTELSEEGCKAFQAGDIEALSEIIADYENLEKQLGEASGTDIVSEAHQKISSVVNKAGGVYKPSGAGNGDMGVAFCSGMEKRMEVEKALAKNKFDVIDLALQTGDAKQKEQFTVSH